MNEPTDFPARGKTKENMEELKRAEKKLEAAEERLKEETALWRLLLEQSRDGIVILDENGGVFEANRQFAEMLGCSLDEVYFLHVWDWDGQFPREQIQEMLKDVDESGARFETRHKRRDGTIIDVELSNNGLVYKGRKLILCLCRDVTERKKMEEAIRESERKYRELSIIDELTRLYNSRHFYSQLALEMNRADRYRQPLALMMLDLDNFKQFTDVYGHMEGDRFLSLIGPMIRGCLRKTDLAFRFGGDEFAILLPMTTLKGAESTAGRIQARLADKNLLPDGAGDFRVTVSIGIAKHRYGETPEEFLRRADMFLYTSKKEGKDTVSLSTSKKHFDHA